MSTTVDFGGGQTVNLAANSGTGGGTGGGATGDLFGSTDTKPYGLTQPDATVVAGWLATRLHVRTDANGRANALELLNAFAAADPVTRAQVQAELANAGYYGTTRGLIYGGNNNEDLPAFAKAINVAVTAQQGLDTAAQNGLLGPGASSTYDLGQNLSQQAQTGSTNGIAAALTLRMQTIQKAQAASAQQVLTEQHYNRQSVYGIADRVAQTLLGRFATDGEKQAVYASLDAKNNTAITVAKAKATALDKQAQETAAANANVLQATTGTQTGEIAPGGMAQETIGRTPIEREQLAQDQGEQRSASVDTFLSALRDGEDPQNPYGFTPTTWAMYARSAGLGANADPTNAGNQSLVARWLAMNLYQRYGSWQAVTAGFMTGPSGAAAYANNPESARWTVPDAQGGSVSAKISQVTQDLTVAQHQQYGLDPNAEPTTAASLGTVVGPATQAANAPLSAQPQVIQTEVSPSPDDQAAEVLKEKNPDEYKAHQLAQTFGSFLSLLGGIGFGNTTGTTGGVS